MIRIPETTSPPPFEITRASHLTFTVTDLPRSRDFYTEVVGLVVSDEDRDTLFLRGVEERSHHSLVLKRTNGTPACVRTALRTRSEEDLDRAKFFFDSRGVKAELVEKPYQSRTLHASDASRTPIELCATMPRVERVDQRFDALRGSGALRFDHYQISALDIVQPTAFYAELGFRVADYMVIAGEPAGVFLHVKETPYDVVFVRWPGPALHHFGYVVNGIHDMIKACDVADSLGLGDCVEFGPGRHGLGHSYFVYLLDPDGHRLELLPPPIYYGDAEDGPVIHDIPDTSRAAASWGPLPPPSWVESGTPFEGVERR